VSTSQDTALPRDGHIARCFIIPVVLVMECEQNKVKTEVCTQRWRNGKQTFLVMVVMRNADDTSHK